MRTKLARSLFLGIFALFSYGCEEVAEKEKVSGVVSNAPDRAGVDSVHYDYRAVYKEGELFLKPLFNDEPAFGPFVANEAREDHFIRYSTAQGRSGGFRTAQKVYRDQHAGDWWFTDNYLSMAACRVDFPDSQVSE